MKRPKGSRNHAAAASGTSLLAISAAKSPSLPTAISFPRSLAKVCFAGTLIALSFAVTYTSSPDAFSPSDLKAILLLGAANVGLLAGATLLLRRRLQNLSNALTALITTVGVATTLVLHTELYLVDSRVTAFGLLGLAAFALFIACRAIDESAWVGVGLCMITAVGLAALVATRMPPGQVEAVSGDTSNIRYVSFSKTPNLYFVSFDSIVPRSLLKKHLDLDGTDFHVVFDGHFRRFKNFFASGSHTLRTLSELLSLDPEVFWSQWRQLAGNPYLFAGLNPSPLLETMHRNGYKTTTAYATDYLGKRQGPFVDQYLVKTGSTYCDLLDDSLRNWASWGYCRLAAVPRSELTQTRASSYVSASGPRFTMEHIDFPGHTSLSYDPSDERQFRKFRDQYLRRSSDAAKDLSYILRRLQQEDPNGILLVYGDHGMWLSRGMDVVEAPDFVIQDRFAVLGGVYPPSVCDGSFDAVQSKGYMTTLDAVHAVLRCLSDGQDPLVRPIVQQPELVYTRALALAGYEGATDFAGFVYE